ncbi:MAG: hypothetical protein K5928_04415 [Prevotella sp.]|nr:hypothetical protein [Prevotella sp.]
MKKIFTIALSAMLAMPALAQEDVTSYIQNPGFDEDLTFQVDGTMKEAISTNTSLSDRSWAYIAADSTVYARPKSTSSQSRSDGRKMDAVNGFKGRIKGWTLESNAEFPKCEWTYFGSVPYDLGETAVPIADDGTTYLAVPQRPTEFDGGEGFVYLRAGWTNSANYKQVVKLPCAVYRLEYWTININPNTTAVAKDLTQIVCRNEVFKDEEGTGLQAQEWTKHEFEFTPTAEFTMQFGYEAANAGSGGQPIVALDGIKLYKIGEASEEEIVSSDLNDMAAKLELMASQAEELGLSQLSMDINDYSMDVSDCVGLELDVMNAKLKEAEEMLKKFQAAIDALPGIEEAITKIEAALAGTSYPGLADLQAVYNDVLDKLATGTADELLALEANALAALTAYYMSQPASEEQPANYTFLVKSPWFIKAAAEPSYDESTATWVFPNADSYTAGSTNDDLSSDGWYVAGRTGGDQRLNWQQGRSCWNAWASAFTDVIAVAQDLTNLPNGYYTVSADMITQAGYITDQHVFASSTAQKVVSPTLNSDGWVDGDAGMWDNGMTTDKVLVVDGKLTIGAEGTGNGNASAGWFLVTNFRLNYLGEADPAAIKQLYTAQVAEANGLIATMHFAADKKALADTIAIYGNVADEQMVAAMAVIKEALNVAKASEAKYAEYMEEGKTLPTVAATLATSEAFKAATDIVKFAYDYVQAWIVSDSATYTKIDAEVNLLKNYLNTYAPVYNQADSVANIASEAGKTLLQGIMATQKEQLTAEMKTAEQVDSLVAELKKALLLVDKQNTYDDATATNYTIFIQNPNLEAEDGWEFVRGNGDKNTTSSQWYDGSATRYIDSYNSNGLTGFMAQQTISDLPNGTYEVGVYTRTPAEGAYIFHTEGADTTFVEIPLDYYTDENTGEQAIASDNHGPIWEEAYTKIVVEGMSEEDPMYSYYLAINNANGGIGRGWKHQQMANIAVTDHTLTIGTFVNSGDHATEHIFTGAWYSVGGWTLTLVAKGDNSGWEGPIAAGITDVHTANGVAEGIYSLNGTKLSQMQRGLNIVVRNGKAQKILVK